SLMTSGQARVPVTYVVSGSGWRAGMAGQHSDNPYSLFAHVGVKTVLPAMPSDAYGLLVSAIRDDDPVVLFSPAASMGVTEEVDGLRPVPIGRAAVRCAGSDVTVVAAGHPVHLALAAA